MASNRIAGLSIEISGETKKLNAALAGTNKEIRDTQAQLRDVERLLKLDPTNVKLLEQRQYLLADAITNTSSKLEQLKLAEEQVQAQFMAGDVSRQQYEGLQREIIATEQELKDLGEHSEQAFGIVDSTAKMGTETLNKTTLSAQDLANALGIRMPPAINTAMRALSGFSGGTLAIVAAIGAAVKALSDLTIGMSKTADEILTLSSTTGIGAQELQEFMYASELVDVSTDTLSSSLSRMIRSMNTARKGTGEQAEAFRQLRVAVVGSNGQLRDSNDVFYDVIDALGKIQNETERDALAMQIFGRSARELNPLIEAGSEKLSELAEEAHEVGVVMSGETLESFGEADDAMQRLSGQFEAAKISLAEQFLPVFQEVLEYLGYMLELLGPAFKLLAPYFDMLAAKLKIINAVLGPIVEAIKWIMENWNKRMTFSEFISGITGRSTQANALMPESVPMLAKGGILNYGSAVVGERGPELLSIISGGRAQVTPLAVGAGASGSSTGTVIKNYYMGGISIPASDVRSFVQVVEMAEREATQMRQGYREV